MDYAALIKELRERLLVTQAELADMLGCAFASVNRWENGHYVPTYRMRRKILALCKKNGIIPEE